MNEIIDKKLPKFDYYIRMGNMERKEEMIDVLKSVKKEEWTITDCELLSIVMYGKVRINFDKRCCIR